MKKLIVYKPILKKLLQSFVRHMCLWVCAEFFHKRKPIPDPLGAIGGNKIFSISVFRNADFVRVCEGIAPNEQGLILVFLNYCKLNKYE